ncbi:peptidoglycan-binding domain-containing protein [Fulvivirgaceae bacterium BMA10]|uniref:Peptidoglycan-binding domain-containing protein n=1 Tax=Splendidivirga corallicola TaxID=3051826 RepID=A0ABT8KUP4_9BACT|nr:peptidoglycan-binding domain-containing protein [Fulvivirgaceae bacterium BMA10]
MKRLALIIITISLVVIAYFQYKKHQWKMNLVEYDYAVSKNIDANYYNPELVRQYYDNVFKLKTFVRSQWRNHGIDVLHPNDDSESLDAVDYFNRLQSLTKSIESKLEHSKTLKDQGFDNLAIQYIAEHGISPKNYGLINNQDYIGLQAGDLNANVWELQKILINQGYDIPKDGKFGPETESALKDLQEKNDMFPSGIVDRNTLKLILTKRE